MIKNIRIQNIQSHDDSYLEFDPGVNIIIGNTDSGKSAIIRALRWVIWNRPSGDSLRSRWGGKSSVEIETETGSVTRSKDKKDEYLVNIAGQTPLSLSAFGTSVPEEINQVLNINEINLQEQLDNHFLLGKGWTPGSVAAHFNKAANISKIDSATSNVNKKIAKLESDITSIKENIITNKSKLKSFEYLDTIESLLEVLEDQENRLNKFIKASKTLETKIQDVEDTTKTIQNLKLELGIEDIVDALLNQIDRKVKQEKVHNSLSSLVIQIKEKQKEIKQLSQYSQYLPLVTSLLTKTNELEAKNKEHKALFATISSIQNITTQLESKKQNYTHLLEKFSDEFPNICPLCNTNVKNDKPWLVKQK
jgi:DNA repair protein SbcC/Rad50